jgi:hypothetical protein
MKLSAAKNQVISSLRMHKWLVSLLISLLLFANGNDIYKAIVEVKKKKCNFLFAQIK